VVTSPEGTLLAAIAFMLSASLVGAAAYALWTWAGRKRGP
jgi:hypothetical protein